MLAPTVGNVGVRYSRHPSRFAVAHGQAVQVASIFGGELAHEGRPPERHEAVRGAHCGEAGIKRVDENEPAARRHSDVVNVDVARDVACLGHIEPVVIAPHLTLCEDILETPELIERARIDAIA